jgi:flagellar biosynthesis/type III secretory pathway M-ring protein FliF/YscJ
MLSGHLSIKKSKKDEAEKPFWISYADLMTALMVLFLVVMIVSMISITKITKTTDQLEKERQEDIQKILDEIKLISPSDVVIDRKDFRINLGSKANFENGKWAIDNNSSSFLRAYVPKLLQVKREITYSIST